MVATVQTKRLPHLVDGSASMQSLSLSQAAVQKAPSPTAVAFGVFPSGAGWMQMRSGHWSAGEEMIDT